MESLRFSRFELNLIAYGMLSKNFYNKINFSQFNNFPMKINKSAIRGV